MKFGKVYNTMSKRSKRTSTRTTSAQVTGINRTLMIAVGVIAAAFLIGAALLVIRGGEPATSASGAEGGAAVASGPQLISPAQYQSRFAGADVPYYLLDVRTPAEFRDGYIEGAANINIDELSTRLNDIPRDQPIVLYCRTGNRSAQAARILDAAGFTEIYDLGGIVTWQSQGYPVVR